MMARPKKDNADPIVPRDAVTAYKRGRSILELDKTQED